MGDCRDAGEARGQSTRCDFGEMGGPDSMIVI